MQILTLGDSFTYGEELEDRNQAWPIRLGDLLNAQVVNLGLPSNSGHGVCRQLLEYISSADELPNLVIIGWPSPGRAEYADESGYFSIWPGCQGNLFIQKSLWRKELLSYVNKYHSSKWLFEKYLQNIIFVQNFLKSQNIKSLMMNVMGNDYYINSMLGDLRKYEKMINTDHFIDWDWEHQRGMIEWTTAANCPKGPSGHFLNRGHQIVTEKVYEHIRNLGWVS